MVLFLTSSPSGPLDKPNYDKVLDESNGFIEQLKTRWKQDMKALLIAAYPNTYEDNDDINHVDYTRKVRYQTIVEETKKLIQIRKEYACLRYSKASDVEKNVSFENIGDFALAYKSEDEHTKLTMIFNPSYQSYEYDLKQDYEMVYDMNQTIKTDKMSKVNVKPYSMMILKSDKEVATKES